MTPGNQANDLSAALSLGGATCLNPSPNLSIQNEGKCCGFESGSRHLIVQQVGRVFSPALGQEGVLEVALKRQP